METARDVESRVEADKTNVLAYEFSPSLLIVICTPYQREQLNRTPTAAVTMDTTYNITSSGLKLTMFLIQSLTLVGRFYPIMHCLHRELNAETYKRMFLHFFRQFGLFGPGGFTGLTIDYADAISSAYVSASAEYSNFQINTNSITTPIDGLQYLRMCKFHFMKSLHTFTQSTDLEPKIRGQITKSAQTLFLVASQYGITSPEFLDAKNTLFDFFKSVKSFPDWENWWVNNSNGRHWKCTFDIGPGTPRARLWPTTNPSEAQNRVMKLDHGLTNRPAEAFNDVLKIQAQKDQQYQLALIGQRPSTSYTRSNRERTPAEIKQLKKRNAGKAIGQGPPKTGSGYKAEAKRERNTQTQKAESLSFPVWAWKNNSCGYDAVLTVVFFLLRSMPLSIVSQLRTGLEKSPSEQFLTRSFTKSPLYLRQQFFVLYERINAAFMVSLNQPARLENVRDDFRALIASALGYPAQRALFGYVNAAAVMEEIICPAFSLSPTPAFPKNPPYFKDIVISKNPKARKLTSLQSLSLQDIEVTENLLVFQINGYFNQLKVPGIAILDDAEFPLIIELPNKGGRMKFLACICSSVNHYRTYVICETSFNYLHSTDKSHTEKSVKPGFYMVDPMATPKVTHLSDVPQDTLSLRRYLPKFKGSQYLPHLIVYHRMSEDTTV